MKKKLNKIQLKRQIEKLLLDLELKLQKSGVYGSDFKFWRSQKKAIKKIFFADKGQLIHCTAAGKTLIFVVSCYIDYKLKGNLKFLTNAHQIMLLDQHIEDFYKVFGSAGIEAGYSMFYSRRFNDKFIEDIRSELKFNIPYIKVSSTNSSTQIKDEINNSLSQKRPHFVFSTYHSAYKLKNIHFNIISETGYNFNYVKNIISKDYKKYEKNDFNVLKEKDTSLFLNNCDLTSFHMMCSADILVTGASAFSILASYLNNNAKEMIHTMKL